MVSAYTILRAAALSAGLIESSRLDRKSWMWTDSMLWGLYALALFVFPGFMFPGHDGEFLRMLIRIFASALMGYEFLWYRVRTTRDDLVIGATLWSRLVGGLFVVFVLGSTYYQNQDKFTEKTLMFDLLAFVMLVLTTVYQFTRGTYKVGNGEQKGAVSNILRLIFLIYFTGGIAQMTFPSWIFFIKKLNTIEALVVRSLGALDVGTSIMAWFATSFRQDEDRANFFLSLLATYIGCFVAVNLAYFWDGAMSPQDALFLHIMFIPAILVLAGNYIIWKKHHPSEYTYNTRSKSQ